jgi:hypothetical protein
MVEKGSRIVFDRASDSRWPHAHLVRRSFGVVAHLPRPGRLQFSIVDLSLSCYPEKAAG